MSFLAKLFKRSESAEVVRVYVIGGDPTEPFKEPSYSTDPRKYGISVLEQPVSDEIFDQHFRHRIKAFITRKDAVRFARLCDVAAVVTPVYDKVDGQWVYNPVETGKLANDLR